MQSRFGVKFVPFERATSMRQRRASFSMSASRPAAHSSAAGRFMCGQRGLAGARCNLLTERAKGQKCHLNSYDSAARCRLVPPARWRLIPYLNKVF